MTFIPGMASVADLLRSDDDLPPLELAFVAGANSTGVGFTVPNDVEEGDLLVACEAVFASPSGIAAPAGFTAAVSNGATGGTGHWVIISAKKADGTEGGNSFGSLNSSAPVRVKRVTIWRPNRPFANFSGASGVTAGGTGAQVMSALGVSAPAVAAAVCCGNFIQSAGLNFSPTPDENIGIGQGRAAALLFNAAPVDVTIQRTGAGAGGGSGGAFIYVF